MTISIFYVFHLSNWILIWTVLLSVNSFFDDDIEFKGEVPDCESDTLCGKVKPKSANKTWCFDLGYEEDFPNKCIANCATSNSNGKVLHEGKCTPLEMTEGKLNKEILETFIEKAEACDIECLSDLQDYMCLLGMGSFKLNDCYVKCCKYTVLHPGNCTKVEEKEQRKIFQKTPKESSGREKWETNFQKTPKESNVKEKWEMNNPNLEFFR